MERFVSIAIWTCALCICLQAKPIPPLTVSFTDSNIKYLRDNVTCPTNSEFYAPTNVKVQCITKALECVRKELSAVVREECQDPEDYVDQAIEFLERKVGQPTDDHASANQSQCICERWPRRPFHEFLEGYESLLQQEITVNNTAAQSAV